MNTHNTPQPQLSAEFRPNSWVTSPPKKKKPLIDKAVPGSQHDVIARLYASGKFTTQKIATTYGITTRQVQRVAKANGVVRTNAESNKLMVPLKNYHRLPTELLKKRKHLSRRIRYELIAAQPWCTLCGSKPSDGLRLEIDHIDGDPTNNDLKNLRVLCQFCNGGKKDGLE